MVAFTRKTHRSYRLPIRKEGDQIKGIYRGLKMLTKKLKTLKAKMNAKARTASRSAKKTTKTIKVNMSNKPVTRRRTHVQKLLNEAKNILGSEVKPLMRSERAATLRARKAEVEAKAKAERIKQAEENAERAAKDWEAMNRRQQDALIEEVKTFRNSRRPIAPEILNLSERFGRMTPAAPMASSNVYAPWRGNAKKKYLQRVQEQEDSL